MPITHIATWKAGTLQTPAAVSRPQGGILAGPGQRNRKASSDRIQHALVIRGIQHGQAQSC